MIHGRRRQPAQTEDFLQHIAATSSPVRIARGIQEVRGNTAAAPVTLNRSIRIPTQLCPEKWLFSTMQHQACYQVLRPQLA